MTAPTTRSVLATLREARLTELARAFAVPLNATAAERQIEALLRHDVHLTEVLPHLGRDELRDACAAHE